MRTTTYFRGLIYADGTKIDYTIWPDALLDRVAEEPTLPDMLDVGYRVLLDKDGRASRWKPPSYRAHIPAKPTETEYRDLVEEFWWSMTYIAKSLWRDETRLQQVRPGAGHQSRHASADARLESRDRP